LFDVKKKRKEAKMLKSHYIGKRSILRHDSLLVDDLGMKVSKMKPLVYQGNKSLNNLVDDIDQKVLPLQGHL
jgi:hypothetical protein